MVEIKIYKEIARLLIVCEYLEVFNMLISKAHCDDPKISVVIWSNGCTQYDVL